MPIPALGWMISAGIPLALLTSGVAYQIYKARKVADAVKDKNEKTANTLVNEIKGETDNNKNKLDIDELSRKMLELNETLVNGGNKNANTVVKQSVIKNTNGKKDVASIEIKSKYGLLEPINIEDVRKLIPNKIKGRLPENVLLALEQDIPLTKSTVGGWSDAMRTNLGITDAIGNVALNNIRKEKLKSYLRKLYGDIDFDTGVYERELTDDEKQKLENYYTELLNKNIKEYNDLKIQEAKLKENERQGDIELMKLVETKKQNKINNIDKVIDNLINMKKAETGLNYFDNNLLLKYFTSDTSNSKK